MPHKYLFAGIAGAVCISVLLLFWIEDNAPRVLLPKNDNSSALSKLQKFNGPLQIKTFSYKAYDENRLDKSLEADLLEVRPRRFMAFNVKSINEAIVRDARFAFFSYSDREPDINFFESALPFIDIDPTEVLMTERAEDAPVMKSDSGASGWVGSLGRVTRIVLYKVNLDFYFDEQKTMALTAETGLMKKKKESARFYNATLHDVRSNRFIKGREIQWDTRRKVFVIPQRYRDFSPSGTIDGKSIEIDMDFNITSLDRRGFNNNADKLLTLEKQ